MMKVEMLVDTAYKGPRKAGDIIDVPDDFGNRWIKNKIAVPVIEEVAEEPKSEVDYSSMKAKELYELCLSKGIEVEEKKPKQYYIDKLA